MARGAERTAAAQPVITVTAPVEASMAETAVPVADSDAVATTRAEIATLQTGALAVAVAAAVALTVVSKEEA
jgi:hypothetical protein